MDAEEFIWNVQERWHYVPKVFDVLDDYDVDRRDDLEKLSKDDIEDLVMALADAVADGTKSSQRVAGTNPIREPDDIYSIL